MDLETLFAKSDTPHYLIFDEFQQLYPQTLKEVQDCYHLTTDKEAAERVLGLHEEFLKLFKEVSSGSRGDISLICFASYGHKLSSGGLPAPFIFPTKLSFACFEETEEVPELVADFCSCTQLHWIRDQPNLPPYLFEFLKTKTDWLVGYASCTLGEVNKHPNTCRDDASLELFLHSIEFLDVLASQRSAPSWKDVVDETVKKQTTEPKKSCWNFSKSCLAEINFIADARLPKSNHGSIIPTTIREIC